MSGTSGVFLHQLFIRECALRIFIKIMQPCMRGGGVKVEVAFFHVLPVVPLRIGQAKSPFLQDGIPAVPQRQAKTKPLRLVANTAQAIFIPAIDAGARLIMIELSPGIAVRAIVFPNGSPGALGEVRPPQTPVLDTMLLILQPLSFCIWLSVHYPVSPLWKGLDLSTLLKAWAAAMIPKSPHPAKVV
jgi:hypothetical protein